MQTATEGIVIHPKLSIQLITRSTIITVLHNKNPFFMNTKFLGTYYFTIISDLFSLSASFLDISTKRPKHLT